MSGTTNPDTGPEPARQPTPGNPRELHPEWTSRRGHDTGNWTDTTTGLLYLRARDYDPSSGQFCAVDALISQTHQPYTYTGNAPLDATDVTGLKLDPPGTKGFFGYSYNFDYDLGLDKSYSAREVASVLKNEPKKVFPFKITGCDKFEDGAICELHPGGDIVPLGNGTVRVSTNATTVRFTVISDGYFDSRGSTITFKLVKECDGVHLQQQARANLSLGLGAPVIAEQTWETQAENLVVAARNARIKEGRQP